MSNPGTEPSMPEFTRSDWNTGIVMLKKLMLSVILLFFSHAAWAFPVCAFNKFNLIPSGILSYYDTNPGNGNSFIAYSRDHNTQKPYEILAFSNQNCKLLYKQRTSSKPISIIKLNTPKPYNSDIIFLTKYTKTHGYAVDAYFIIHNIVKPMLLDLSSESMTPQFPANDTPNPSVLVCNNFMHDCDIYVYAPKKEKFIKQQSYHCDQPCSIAKIRAEMIQQPKSRTRTKSKP